MRLTAAYGGLILATGTGLLSVVVFLLHRAVDDKLQAAADTAARYAKPAVVNGHPVGDGKLHTVKIVGGRDVLPSMLTISAVSLAIFASVSLLIGWWVAGRVLAPVRRISLAARRMSSENLHERIGLDGPDDELKELADTVDGMLARLEAAFDSQRRFVANASHELRTPLAVQRTAIQIGLTDPDPGRLAVVRDDLLAANRRSVELIDGLLLLAQSDRGLARPPGPVPLHELAAQVLAEHEQLADRHQVGCSAAVVPVTVVGDHSLLTRLLANLVQNAIRHNHPGGKAEITINPDKVGGATLIVTNTGPVVPDDRLKEMFEPFVRLSGEGSEGGAGLGLSIVASIVRAHCGTVTATGRPGGGLRVRVDLPPLAAGRLPASATARTLPGPRRDTPVAAVPQ